MTQRWQGILMYAIMAVMLALVGIIQGWSNALGILNLCLISAIMALGVNIQWGYAGLLNVGVMGFAALGGLAVVLVAAAPVPEALAAGGAGVMWAALIMAVTVVVAYGVWKLLPPSTARAWALVAVAAVGSVVAGGFYFPATDAIEAVDPSLQGYLGGLGLPVLVAWVVAPLLAAAAAWFIGKIALGLRADYLAIATLGISEIVVVTIKNEEWLTRGVKNVVGLPRPVPTEMEVRVMSGFDRLVAWTGLSVNELSSIVVKLGYTALFAAILCALLFLFQLALHSPWGRMMRAIRDNEIAASAMGKNVTRMHLKVFIIGSAIVGLAGAMLVTLDGQFTPGGYQPLRYTFLIWVMVIVGGSGNNWGSVFGGFLIWFCWVQAEPVGVWLLESATAWLPDGSGLRAHLLNNASQIRLVLMGAILLVALRFMPRGLFPEKTGV
ncbi:branched-chain amino acid ABC transporter permease [Aerobium aerolatum]|uniref:Branched-chain amino acid transport system permease protein n=1 Tax=Aquamicrobium aerolatum DSM 21857 TaxID=1121003 RepID=A0A1I3I385_9HYPH|nr:branched-chain amino acid ABC transporter permease [Aquamicrobium aerolatum]SFI42444.1 branched-chain amino acid transport system permease protein [Aquamicrobium aerolatum DSM 21857]